MHHTVAACALVVLLLAAAAPQPAEAGLWDTISSAFGDAWNTTKNVFNSAKE